MKRPLAVAAIALIWGIILADVNNYHSWGLVSLAISLIVFILTYKPLKGRLSVFCLLAVPFMIIGYTLHSINENHYYNSFMELEGQSVTVQGVLIDEPEQLEGKMRFTLKVCSINSEGSILQKNHRIQVNVYSMDPIPGLKYGSIISVSGEIKIPAGRRNFGGVDTRKFLAARGISGTMNVSLKTIKILEGREFSWIKNTGYKLRHSIITTLDKCLPSEESSVIAGMLIGYTANMPEELEEDFRRAGLSHIMAVSGANIAFLLVPFLWLLKKIGFNPRWSSAIAFPAMIFYVFATGMEASVVRAAIMAGVTLTGMLLWRNSDIYCSIAFSAIIILLNNSFMLYDLGFILSFSATLSLVIFYKAIFKKLPARLPKFIKDVLAGTIAAQIGVIPIIAYCFNTFSVISILSNLLIVPLTGLLTVLGALAVILGNIYMPIGLVLGVLSRIVTDIILFITRASASIPWAEINIATPSFILVIIYYFLILYFRYCHFRIRKEAAKPFAAAILAICGVLIVLISIPNRALKIYFADVGQGDCTIIRTPAGHNIIIDGGGSINDERGSFAGERIVVPLLYNLNMTQIDLMIASHGHVDHIGGLKTVLDKVKVKGLIVADAPDIEMNELTDKALNMGIPITRMKEGGILYQEDGLIIKALYPLEEEWLMPNASVANANELSLVVRLDYGDFNALFTGDIGFETEKRIMNDIAVLNCDLLKVAHHGSKYSSDKEFLANIDPSLAVISVGRNTYGHPDPETLDRLSSQGARILKTIESGGILVEVWENYDKMRITTVVK